MQTITVVRELTGAGTEVTYIPVPSRGTVHSVRVASDLQMDIGGTLKFGRGAVAVAANLVNTVTVPAVAVAAGTILDGVPDATYKGNVFDPDSATAAHQCILMQDDATFLGGAGTIVVSIEYDDSAYIAQAALEA